ncbi:hypothetical protein PR202_ga01772 [Eleusine coracana subsp. coracana]|uniref:PUM-HD domain-containing protein n=1 Tax=Eleusine coracana subsp. coracana TaxID=191504 RepID=A0AAV5BL25_ELECO|nr:hypothetical protein PR202_ga01085 [Eleusine coracana subsp. coracana]GJM85959.1 hypothetical protein PR202_ga01772 [Eleusine coracana subsp. coracana]
MEPFDSSHGHPGWYGSYGGSVEPSDYVQHQHVGFPYWYVGGGGGESSGGGGAFNLSDDYTGYGADTHGTAEDWAVAGGVSSISYGCGGDAVLYWNGSGSDGDWRAGGGMSRNGLTYGAGGASDDGGNWYWPNGGASDGDWRDPCYGTDLFYENGSGGRSNAPFPASRVDAGVYQPQHPITGYWHAGGGSNNVLDRYSEFLPGNNNNDGSSSSFPQPRIPNGMPYEPQHARADHYWHPGTRGNAGNIALVMPCTTGTAKDAAAEPFPFPRRGALAAVNDLIASNLRALTIGNDDGGNSVVPRGLAALLTAGDHHDALSSNAVPGGGGRGLFNADPYVFDEVAGDLVRFMAHSAGHVLVEKLSRFWTDDEMITRVLGILRTASAGQIIAAAKNHAVSTILQTLIGRIHEQPEQVASFTSTLAGLGESGVLSLIEDMSGSLLIVKCLEKFSASQNQFITEVAMKFSYRICHDRFGCHVFNRCIDEAGDDETRDSLIHAVCRDGLQLAEHGAGNYVVQHVIQAVPAAPWAKDALHLAFRGRYVSLSRQKASSHVVQRCLQHLSTQQGDEIVFELLNCERYCSFGELISDPYANYVLQTGTAITVGLLLSNDLPLNWSLLRGSSAGRPQRASELSGEPPQVQELAGRRRQESPSACPKMQSSVMAFFPKITSAKLDLHSMYRKYRTLISRAMRTLSSCCGSLPFFVSIGFLMSRLYNYILIDNHIYGQQFILGRSANLRGESTMGMENSELCHAQPNLSSLLEHKREYVRLALQCICYPASLKLADITQKKLSFDRQRTWCSQSTSAFWRILARNEQYLASMMVLVALQFFLRLIKVNVTTLFFPMLSRTTSSKSSVAVIGNIVLVLVNSCGVLGSALATKQYGREVTFTIGAVLMVAIPVMLEVQIGVGGGTRMPTSYAATMFALTCVVSCGLSWSWGSFIWTIPSWKVHSAGQVVAMALNFGFCFAQMQFFLMMLCRLKNAILAYYAMWIWS